MVASENSFRYKARRVVNDRDGGADRSKTKANLATAKSNELATWQRAYPLECLASGTITGTRSRIARLFGTR